MARSESFSLFSRIGIELEYMIVDVKTLDVRPFAERLLGTGGDVERGLYAWSNELVSHVLEIKLDRPAPSFDSLGEGFAAEVRHANALLAGHGCCLMPSAMHPWMEPARELMLWPYACAEIYAAYDRIFTCHGHGWANLQSTHINLPFANDEEFARLHAAIRLVLPLLPGLAASSPYQDGAFTGVLDTRLRNYGGSCSRVRSCRGEIIPEPVYTQAAYEAQVLQPMYEELAPHDPEGLLQDEYSNARGAIARFQRKAIEIRLLDIQESPRMDLALCALVRAVVKAVVEERWCPIDVVKGVSSSDLIAVYQQSVVEADDVVVDSPGILECFGWSGSCASIAELWAYLLESTWAAADDPALRSDAAWLIQSRPLAHRLVSVAGMTPPRERLQEVYRRLCECLAADERFDGI